MLMKRRSGFKDRLILGPKTGSLWRMWTAPWSRKHSLGVHRLKRNSDVSAISTALCSGNWQLNVRFKGWLH